MIRVIDVLLSVTGLVVSLPFLVLAALGIKLSSPGPILYGAERAGVGGAPFTMHKLRTMHVNASAGGRITSGRDPRIFPWGRLIRRTKLDEIPQLLNVLTGDMSLVGPRPEDVTLVREHYTPMMWESLRVRPGVTGPGSLDYFASEDALPGTPDDAELIYVEQLLPRKIALDLVFVREPSVTYYFELLFRTCFGVLGGGRIFARRAAREQAMASRYLAEAPPSDRGGQHEEG